MKNLIINDKITIPARFLSYKAVTASGAGGQNVNKVASKVQLTFALEGLYVVNNEYQKTVPDYYTQEFTDLDNSDLVGDAYNARYFQLMAEYEKLYPYLITDGAFSRLRAKCIDADQPAPYILITSQKTRDQVHNLEDALDKLKELILDALVEPVKRIATKATNGSVIKRLRNKKEHSAKKQNRKSMKD